MKAVERWFIGGSAAMLPVLVKLVNVDLPNMEVQGMAPAYLTGVVIRGVLMFFMGALVVHVIYGTEIERMRIFMGGLGAPALLATMINTAGSPQAALDTAPTNGALTVQLAALAPMPSFGQESLTLAINPEDSGPVADTVLTYALPEEDFSTKVIQGLLGRTTPRTWFVIAGEDSTWEGAYRQAVQMLAGQAGFEAAIYAPYGDILAHYTIVLGGQLTRAEAGDLRRRALKAGLAKSVRAWDLLANPRPAQE